MSDLDDEEIKATRILNGVDKENNLEEDIMSEEAFNELIDNFEEVETLTEYGRKAIKQNVKNLQKRIKELEEENKTFKNFTSAIFNDNIEKEFIPVQKVKDKIEELNKAYEYSKNENGESKYYYPDHTIEILEELLEENK